MRRRRWGNKMPPPGRGEKYNALDFELYLSYTRDMKTAISIPDPLFNSVERMAHKLNVSRSEFFANAAKTYIDHVKNQSVTDKLNKIYSKNRKESQLPKDFAAMQAASLPGDEW
jgi:hypothetical protein